MKSFTDGASLYPALVIENNGESICLIQGKTEVILITDKSEFEEDYSGLITFVNEDGIQLESTDEIIMWEYVEELSII